MFSELSSFKQLSLTTSYDRMIAVMVKRHYIYVKAILTSLPVWIATFFCELHWSLTFKFNLLRFNLRSGEEANSRIDFEVFRIIVKSNTRMIDAFSPYMLPTRGRFSLINWIVEVIFVIAGTERKSFPLSSNNKNHNVVGQNKIRSL